MSIHCTSRQGRRRLGAVCALLLPVFAQAQGNSGDAPGQNKNVEVMSASYKDSGFVLRDAPGRPIDLSVWKEAKDKRRVPYADPPNHEDDLAAQTSHRGSAGAGTTPGAATTAGLGFDGLGSGFTGPNGTFSVRSAPPDTTGAAGTTQYVQWVNTSFAVFSKSTGQAVYGPVAGNTLFTGMPNACATSNDGDPIVLFDKIANRWVMMQFAVPSGGPYFQCVAVSQTADATGAYDRYAFQYTGFNDYPKAGVWPDAYYVAYNIFNGNSFGGAKVCAMDRAAMLAGQAATQQCFQLSTSYGGLLPSDFDGTILPPAGTPNFFVNIGTARLNLWKFKVDWANTANSVLTGPTAIPVTSFAAACGGGTCVPQSGTSQQLDSLADRAMYRLAYRRFADGRDSLVVNHAVRVGATNKPTSGYSGTRWYEIRNANTTPVVYQQSTYAPDTNHRWMGSIAMDKQGNIALGYSVSSGSMKPAIRYATRLASDPLNTLSNETTIVQGGGAQGRSLSRWGDYSHMSVDPSDDCTFWFTTEYLKADGTFNWNTRIASFKINGCQ